MILRRTLSAVCGEGDPLTGDEMRHRLESRTITTPDRGPELIAAHVAMSLILITAVLARAYTRKFIVKHKLRVDDFVILAAMVSFIGLTIDHGIAVSHGLGKHAWDIIPQEKGPSKALPIEGFVFYMITTCATKISVLLFLFDLNPYKTMARLIKIVISIVALFMIISIAIVVLNFFCKILNKSTKIAIPLTNSVLDFTVWLLPVMFLSHVQTSLSKKVEMVGVLCVGLIACIASVIAMYFLYKSSSNPSDITWYAVDVLIWSSIEVCLGILCSCAPTAKQLFFHLRSKVCSQHSIHCRILEERAFDKANTVLMVPVQNLRRPPGIDPASSDTSLGIPEEFNGDFNYMATLHVIADVELNIPESSIRSTEQAIRK